MPEKFNISVPRKYTKDGVEKTFWSNVGTLTKFPAREDKPEGYKVELPIFGNTEFVIFPQKDREEKGSY